MGLYQNSVTLFNYNTGTGLPGPITATGNYTSPSFSAANLAGASLFIAWGAATVSSPTAAFALNLSTDGGVTWKAVPATTGSLTDIATFTATPPTNTASQQVKSTANTAYIGNLLQVVMTIGGGVTSLPVKVTLDAQKRFPDNANGGSMPGS